MQFSVTIRRNKRAMGDSNPSAVTTFSVGYRITKIKKNALAT